MKAIILAAGRGSRMKKLTEEKPKCLVKVRGKALLDWQLKALRSAGINQISIVTGYKRELLIDRRLNEFFNTRWMETNMVRSLMCADEWLLQSPCIVSYSDIFYFPDAVNLLLNCNEKMSITFDPNWEQLWTRRFTNPLIDSETFKINKEYIITEIGNKPYSLEDIQGQYMGLLKFTPDSWQEVKNICLEKKPTEFDKLDMTSLLQLIINKGNIQIKGIPYLKEWGEFDSIEDLNLFN